MASTIRASVLPALNNPLFWPFDSRFEELDEDETRLSFVLVVAVDPVSDFVSSGLYKNSFEDDLATST